LSEEHFHYIDGRPAQGMAAVRFGWCPGGLRLTGIGRRGCDLVLDATPHLLAAMMRQSGRLLGVKTYFGVNTLALSRFPRKQFCPSLVLTGTKEFTDWADAFGRVRDSTISVLEQPGVRERMERLIADALFRQLKFHAQDQSGAFVTQEDEADFEAAQVRLAAGDENSDAEKLNPLRVRVLSCSNRPFFIRKSPQHTAMVLGVRDLEFEVNADLSGRWYVGRYHSHGYGLTFPARQQRNIAVLKEAA
jgi:hypothetical protein